MGPKCAFKVGHALFFIKHGNAARSNCFWIVVVLLSLWLDLKQGSLDYGHGTIFVLHTSSSAPSSQHPHQHML
jgi:hypothetical protein